MTNAQISTIFAHLMAIIVHGTEIRDVAVSSCGVSCYFDTLAGVDVGDCVSMHFWLNDRDIMVAHATVGQNSKLVGEWIVQGDTWADFQAAWLATAANGTGRAHNYWLRPLEMDEAD